jgi:hypothetical protein
VDLHNAVDALVPVFAVLLKPGTDLLALLSLDLTFQSGGELVAVTIAERYMTVILEANTQLEGRSSWHGTSMGWRS